MSDTPLTDALLLRHQKASVALPIECGLSVVRAHALQQVEELIEHAKKMESELADANARVDRLQQMWADNKPAARYKAHNTRLVGLAITLCDLMEEDSKEFDKGERVGRIWQVQGELKRAALAGAQNAAWNEPGSDTQQATAQGTEEVRPVRGEVAVQAAGFTPIAVTDAMLDAAQKAIGGVWRDRESLQRLCTAILSSAQGQASADAEAKIISAEHPALDLPVQAASEHKLLTACHLAVRAFKGELSPTVAQACCEAAIKLCEKP